MTYRGPLYGPPPDDMPPSKYKDLLLKHHEQMRDGMDKIGTNLNAWALWEMMKINVIILDEYERFIHE